jgi:radical SAM protein with 4Fe4S-binding SPASM domain
MISRIKREKGIQRPSLRLYQPLSQGNVHNVEGMVDLVRDAGCNELHFTPFRSRRGRLSFLALSPDDIATLEQRLKDIKNRLAPLSIDTNVDKALHRYRIGESAWEETPCYVGWVQAHVKPDGSVFPCNSSDLAMGKLEAETFLQIWNGPAFQQFRQGMFSRDWRHEMEDQLDCGFCGQLPNNERIHHIFRWLHPFRRQRPA